MDDKDPVGDYIDETIKEYEEGERSRVFDSDMLRQPISVLEPRAPVVVEPQAPALEAVTIMQTERIGCVLVARAGKLKGIFTERDVLSQIVGKGIDPAKTAVRKVMTSDPESLRMTDSIAYALNKMSVGGYRHIPLVDKAGAAVGVISVKDIVNYVVDFFPREIMNLPTLPRGNYTQAREGA